MPKWKPAPAALTSLFTKALERIPGAESRKMFGYLAGFVEGNMFAGIFEDSIILRLSEPDRANFVNTLGGNAFEPMPGRVMREYVVVPRAVIDQPKKLSFWLNKAGDYAASLPAKPKKAARSGKR